MKKLFSKMWFQMIFWSVITIIVIVLFWWIYYLITGTIPPTHTGLRWLDVMIPIILTPLAVYLYKSANFWEDLFNNTPDEDSFIVMREKDIALAKWNFTFGTYIDVSVSIFACITLGIIIISFLPFSLIINKMITYFNKIRGIKKQYT